MSGIERVRAELDEAGFQVTEEIDTGDLSGVKAESWVMEPVKGVLFTIQKPSIRRILNQMGKDAPSESESNPCIAKRFTCHARLTEGVDEQGTYKNKVLFPEIIVWVDLTHEFYQKDRYQKETKPYLAEWKAFIEALGYEPTSAPKINDEFLTQLEGRQFRADITAPKIRVPENQPDGTTKWTVSDDRKNVVRGYSAA